MHCSPPGPPADITLLLGQLLERSTGTTLMLERIDHRLEIGDHRMNSMTDRITSVEAEIKAHRREKRARMNSMTDRITSVEAEIKANRRENRARRSMPPAERLVKMVLPYGIAIATLAATGSADAAKGILLALLGGR